MYIPVSNFNDKKVTLDQELGEKTVALRDLETYERQFLINSHKKLYWVRSNLPLLSVLLIIYEAFVIYFAINYLNVLGFDNAEIFIFLILTPPLILFQAIRKEENLYKDIGRPVVKTVGTLTTHKIVHRRHTEKYFTVEDARFDRNMNDSFTIDYILSRFGENQSFFPVRIEYSPNSKTVWEVKKRALNNLVWQPIYSKISPPEVFMNVPRSNLSSQNLKRKAPA